MCGICGIFRPDGAPVDAVRVERMREALEYRGPDGAGMSRGPGYALGHRRLAILDLSADGLQPMANETGSVEIVFNGEIYNFAALKTELQSAGHRFRSRTDTEVLLHGYEQWGIEGLLRRIRGMYAFALLDHDRYTIQLARDPLGKKPLFFRLSDGELVFASAVRALVRGLTSVPDVAPAGVDQLLWNLYIPGPGTILEGVEKLLPGHALSLARDGRRRDFMHWQPDFVHLKREISDEQWLERIDDGLERAVKKRLVADVPVGILLSGGVDSSLVAAMACKSRAQVDTFAVATDDPNLDESVFAKAVAQHCGTTHHELKVRGVIYKDLPRLISAMGEPLADASAANVFAIAQEARQFVSVVLTGDGGDEGFGGYRQFLAYYVAGVLNDTWWWLQYPLRLATKIPLESATMHSARTLRRLAVAPVERTLCSASMTMDLSMRESLYTRELQQLLPPEPPYAHCIRALPPASDGASSVDRIMQAHMLTVLPDDYLAKVDSGTMAVNLEARSPFLDLELVELAMKIPASARFRHFKAKSLLRRLAERYVPVQCVRRRKRGFVAPVGKWLRRDWADLVEEFVLSSAVGRRGWFRTETLRRIVDEHRRGVDHGYLLWALIVLEMWLQMSVEQKLKASDVL